MFMRMTISMTHVVAFSISVGVRSCEEIIYDRQSEAKENLTCTDSLIVHM